MAKPKGITPEQLRKFVTSKDLANNAAAAVRKVRADAKDAREYVAKYEDQIGASLADTGATVVDGFLLSATKKKKVRIQAVTTV